MSELAAIVAPHSSGMSMGWQTCAHFATEVRTKFGSTHVRCQAFPPSTNGGAWGIWTLSLIPFSFDRRQAAAAKANFQAETTPLLLTFQISN